MSFSDSRILVRMGKVSRKTVRRYRRGIGKILVDVRTLSNSASKELKKDEEILPIVIYVSQKPVKKKKKKKKKKRRFWASWPNFKY